MEDGRDIKGRFLPGNKIGGRTKLPQGLKEDIRAACSEAAAVLIGLLHSKSEKIRLAAACELLDRGYGKPETMSKVELSSGEDMRIVFHWVEDNESDCDTVQTETSSEGNTQANREI